MSNKLLIRTLLALVAAWVVWAPPMAADILIQCPGDTNGDGISDTPGIVCKHLVSGDGYLPLADGKVLYTFGFNELVGVPPNEVMQRGGLMARFPGPAIVLEEGDKFYLTLTNVSLLKRPDLFDPHTVHFHGIPNASSIFDGLPESAIAINQGASATYFYQISEPGTFMYHCHAEATEHMQMGMLARLWVHPKQDKLTPGTVLGTHVHQAGHRYAYNDGDGSTRYDVEVELQLSGLDSKFHDASEKVQPLPFALMKDNYSVINGRGYPDTVNPNRLPAPSRDGVIMNATSTNPAGTQSSVETSLITARTGQKVLVRMSLLDVTRGHTLISPNIPMLVVGKDAKLLRGPNGASQYYRANSISLGSGETADALLDLAGVAPGTYFLYSSELNHLSNNTEDFGGMMTEIVVTP